MKIKRNPSKRQQSKIYYSLLQFTTPTIVYYKQELVNNNCSTNKSQSNMNKWSMTPMIPQGWSINDKKQKRIKIHCENLCYCLTGENCSLKTKKCQSAAGNTPDLIQTECVADSGLTCPNKKIYEQKNTYKSQNSDGNWVKNCCVREILKRNETRLKVVKKILAETAENPPLQKVSDCRRDGSPAKDFSVSNKVRNKQFKQINGNGKKSLSVSHWNIGAKKWVNKVPAIQAIVDVKKPDILFMSEENLDVMTPDYKANITGYNILKQKLLKQCSVYRLIVLVKEGLYIEMETSLMEEAIVSIWLRVKVRGAKKTLICGVYREHRYVNQQDDSSNSPAAQTMRWSKFMRQVETAGLNENIHLIGDFNLDFLKWGAPDANHANMINCMKNTLELNGFGQLVQGITRTWPGQLDSLIDHIWSNDQMRIIAWRNEVQSVGDHNLITMMIRTSGMDSKQLDTKRRDMKNFNPDIYIEMLGTVNWETIYDCNDLDTAWVSANTKSLMTDRDRVREEARCGQDPTKWNSYRKLRNKVNTELDKDRREYYLNIYSKQLEQKDVSGIYKLAKIQAGWKATSTPVSFLVNGRKVTAPQELADVQLQSFKNKTATLIRNLPPPPEDPLTNLEEAMRNWQNKDNREVLKFRKVTKLETLQIINKLGYSSSTAHDRLDAMAVKHGASILHGPITHVINLSIGQSKFAAHWKIGRLLPLHKGKGKIHQDPDSFRPISLLPVIGKIMERVIQPQILDFMSKTRQFNENNYSYRKEHSTMTAMIQISNDIFEGCNENEITTSVTIDQSATFDVLHHNTLMRKRKVYNFSQEALDWIVIFRSAVNTSQLEPGTRTTWQWNMEYHRDRSSDRSSSSCTSMSYQTL